MTAGRHSPRILDASALVELMHGHPTMMRLVSDADAGQAPLVVTALAALEAQAAIQVEPALWEHILGLRGLIDMALSPRTAVDVAALAGPLLEGHPRHLPLYGAQMVAEVVHAAQQSTGVVVTRGPEAYRGFPVPVTELPDLPLP
ncbi:hypothetical protein [Paractinoplanes atraurantiacus]|uniref:PIN domain-containing protein n=1 Tax=Paractinoplanes atraurantiacus TaxID=1036182 RepID=A0A285KKW9_9ACTN|nr:hypothetical protein [Actinoplanes atraurantiacus]SNY72863.1 hypothetical protein SAMN05421748_14435 [Actinoplanes atraurantiacus]